MKLPYSNKNPRSGKSKVSRGVKYTCAICLSPHRKDIEKEWLNRRISRTQIFDKYIKGLPISQSFENFYSIVRRHIKDEHGPANNVLIQIPNDSTLAQTDVTVESFAQKLLEMGSIKLETMDPNEVKISDVIAGQKLLIEKSKLKLTEDAMTIQMARLFGTIPLEGEVIDNGDPQQLQGSADQ